jgi:DNA-binding transcriptional LysR family regulator
MESPLLELDLLTTLVAIADLGGFAKAGVRVGRTQSAVSLQMQRLEELAGRPLFSRRGRVQTLTEAGQTLVHYARRMLALNEEALGTLGNAAAGGTVRLGTAQDLAEAWLPPILGEFAAQYPMVRLECRVDRSAPLIQAVREGQVDLALTMHGQHAGATVLGELPLAWIGLRRQAARSRSTLTEGPLPLVMLNPPCDFRDRALAALDQAGIPWRIAFSSLSVSALWAAVRAGLGVTVRTRVGLPTDLAVLPPGPRLPKLPSTQVALHTAPGDAPGAATRLAAMLAADLRKRLAADGRGRSTAGVRRRPIAQVRTR